MRRSIEEKDKKLIRLLKRLNEIGKLQRALEPVPLEKPIQRGFKKSFKVRDDFSRSRWGNDLNRIIGEINSTIYCRDPSFKMKKRHNNQKEDVPHKLGYISPHRWEKLDWPAHFKKWFVYRDKHTYQTSYGNVIFIKGYFFKHPHYFDTFVEPHFLTHSQPVNPKLESEEAEIKAFMEHNLGWERLNHLKGHRLSRWDIADNEKQERKEYREALRIEMEEFEENYLDAPEI